MRLVSGIDGLLMRISTDIVSQQGLELIHIGMENITSDQLGVDTGYRGDRHHSVDTLGNSSDAAGGSCPDAAIR
jgi:hypothetical protein